ncbi:MAG: LD-carboxypeptidase [Bacteroidales bacterium]|nr:LD-carboxypeptidase [Bacteroidales bacterium]
MLDAKTQNKVQSPQPIKAGDKVAIVATARKISEAELDPAKRLFESWGLRVVLPKNIYAEDNQFAGNDEQRAADLQWALDNEEVKAVVCARGGYGTVRIIDQIDFTQFAKSPKWVVGYSDVTVIHSHIQTNLGIATLHATMPLNIPDDAVARSYPSIEALKRALFEVKAECLTAAHPLNRKGEAEAVVVGGNLSILYSLCGSASDIDTEGKILFIEDLDEYLYHIDRMMQNLKRTGKLKRLKGLIVGGMTDMHDNTIPFGKTAEEIVMDAVKGYDYPICFNAPFGHIGTENKVLILGVKLTMQSYSDGTFTLSQTMSK